ncbi:MAG: hypothetical protein ABR583_08545 [Gaiellaceae bacterium]
MRSTAWMRGFLLAAGVFALLAGSLLALGADRTERRFAWTIASELTAAFLNGMYWTATALLLLSARERLWRAARAGAVAAILFMSLLFVVMLVHFELLHTDDHRVLVSAGAWGFLASYAVLPAAGILALARQLRAGDDGGPRRDPVPPWLRALLVVQAGAALAVGAALLLAGTGAQALWPWPLTPIGARAIGSWVVGLGVLSAIAARDADRRRISPVASAYLVLAALQAIALARFGEEVQWDRPAAWFYAAGLASFLAVGLAGLARGFERARDRQLDRPTPEGV